MADQADLVTLTIDGRSVSVARGSTIWMAAEKLGIEVPIYCYHPKMDPLGACRMCFVAVEKMPKLQTACTTVVTEGMAVSTDTPAVKKARAGTLEFLLINHPLDCPICDKGGECDLQDFTLRYGPGNSRFDVAKRHYPKPIPVSDTILLDRERCIACQRCVRFCQDVAMENGLVMKQRGFKTEVGPDPEAPFDSIFSGNVVEMCPVGALTARNYRFVTRPWELRRTPSVCANCSVGCNVKVDVRVDKVLRQYSRTNDAIDDGWLCDRGRWDLDQVNSPDRLRTPLIRRHGKLEPATWDEAIALVARRLGEIARASGPAAVGGIGSTHTTNEEAYLFQKLLRAGLGTNNVDHRHGVFPAPASGSDASGAGLPWVWTGSIAELDDAADIVLLGADPYHRQPIFDLRIRKAIRRGARVHILSADANRLDRLAASATRYRAGETSAVARALLALVREMAGLTAESAEGAEGRGGATSNPAASPLSSQEEGLGSPTGGLGSPTGALGSPTGGLGVRTPEDLAALAERAGTDLEALRGVARALAGSKAATILYDEEATRETSGGDLAATVLALALATNQIGRPGAGAGPLFADVNSLGARDMGLLPDSLPGYGAVTDGAARAALAGAWGVAGLPAEPGHDAAAMLGGAVRALYVMGADPASTMEDPAALDRLEFLVVQDLFLTETARRAHVVLPAVAYTEKDGTFTNTERCVQNVRRAMIPLPGARADWEILLDLARALGLGWTTRTPAEVLAEIGRVVPIYAGATRRGLGMSGLRWPLVPAMASDKARPDGASANGAGPDSAGALAGTPRLGRETRIGDLRASGAPTDARAAGRPAEPATAG
ncbi:MAG TPA: NADH-quinone oxidoreductase subunit NuoG [Ktedonobacterales bacterium]